MTAGTAADGPLTDGTAADGPGPFEAAVEAERRCFPFLTFSILNECSRRNNKRIESQLFHHRALKNAGGDLTPNRRLGERCKLTHKCWGTLFRVNNEFKMSYYNLIRVVEKDDTLQISKNNHVVICRVFKETEREVLNLRHPKSNMRISRPKARTMTSLRFSQSATCDFCSLCSD